MNDLELKEKLTARKANRHFNVLNLGAGTQSSVVLLMADQGLLPPLDAAIFADTKWEPKAVYDHLQWLINEVSIPVHITDREGRSLREDTINNVNEWGREGYAQIPFHIMNDRGKDRLSRRLCTKHYKIVPLRRKLIEITGKKIYRSTTTANIWFGISYDEATRMRDPDVQWLTHYYPLVDMKMTRQDCIDWFAERYPGRVLPRSACLGCPLKGRGAYMELLDGPYNELEDTLAIDDLMHDSQWSKDKYKECGLKDATSTLRELYYYWDIDTEDAFEEDCSGICGV